MKRAALVPLRALTGIAFLALGVVGATSCGGGDEVKIVLLDPCADNGGTSFKDASIYTEIMVVNGGCPTDSDLAAGDVSGVVYSGVAPSDSPSLPTIGELEEGSYGFVVLVKDANCGVIGFGCTAADLAKIREVRIAVRAWTNNNTCQPLSGGSCPAPKTCEEGRCVGESTSDGGGAGCDLSVVKAGKLPAPATTGAELTGPGVVSTSTGFVIGYREYSSDGVIKATLVPLSDAGTLGAPTRIDVASGCIGKTLSDGVGMAYKGTGGLMVMSLPDCGDPAGAGASFLPFNGDGSVGAWSAPHNSQFGELTLGRTHSLAPASQTNEWEFVYRAVDKLSSQVTIQRAIIQGNAFKAGAPIDFLFSSANAAFAQVATGTGARAVVGGGIAGEAGTGTTVQFSRIEPTSGDTHNPVGEITLASGAWSTVTAWGDRVVSGAPGASGLTWSATQVTTSGISPLQSDESIGSGTVVGADVAAHGDNLLFALGKASEISVQRLTGAEGTLSTTAADTQTLSDTVGGVSLSSFDGRAVAIAAGRSRAAVVWLTSKTSGEGGYALLQCAK